MRTMSYRQDIQRGIFTPRVGQVEIDSDGQVLPDMDESRDEYYIFQPTDTLPDMWVSMHLRSCNGPLPSGKWIVDRANSLGYSVLDLCRGLPSLWADEDIWCPSLDNRIMLFKPNTTGRTPRRINQELFSDIVDVDSGYAAVAVFAAAEVLSGNMQDWVDQALVDEDRWVSIREGANHLAQVVGRINGEIVDLTDPEHPGKFWTWKTKLAAVALGAGLVFVGVKYGVPAWRRRKIKKR
jgi:hypothetical protein